MRNSNLKQVMRFFQKYNILILIGILQIIPLIARMIPCLKERDWVSTLLNIIIICLVIIIRESRQKKLSEQTEKKISGNADNIRELSGATSDISANTITISGNVEDLVTWLRALEKRVRTLERQRGYSTKNAK